MSGSETTEPLIPTSSIMSQELPTSGTSAIITSLAALKIVLGASCVVAPRLACSLFLLKLPPQAVIAGRLFGSSCAALGALTLHLNRRFLLGKSSKDDLEMAVLLNIVADTVDTVSCVAGYSSGMYGLGALGMLGGGCVVLATLGTVGYKGL
ncbi:hypothetical protein B0T10DRAFT_562092 [Thelonectria olida]|uniref:Uncharacterized protein n=1 Tax=Thelonectria olida TaxID=1576542 RepID=A0A9P8W3Y0_9HYPO|nr:hypothetical protein B0T10DRAFT_562092 [Thelonectria olida]